MAFRHILLNVGMISIMIIILSIAQITKNDNILNGSDLIPLHYNVKIKFDVDRNVLFGNCNITIKINSPTKDVTVLNSAIFGIIKIILINNNDNQKINIPNFVMTKTYIHLDLKQTLIHSLIPGTYILNIIYVHTISDNGDGFESFYRDKEEDKVLNDKTINVISAGELFPCWDKSIFKSTFKISIWHHKSYQFISSMPIQEKVVDVNNMLWTHFEESILMSARNLAVVITKLIHISTSKRRGAKFWYREEITNQIQFAEDIAQGVIKYLNKRNIEYISRIDYYVFKDIPQFEDNNTDIRGFIMLREKDIIYNNISDHIVHKMKIANLIAKRTIAYWYYNVSIWSKEGFITFLAAHILHETKLYDRMIDLFVVQTQQEALRFDTFLNIDRLSLSTSSISSVYLLRPYFNHTKSFVAWRMLHHIMSDNLFWIGINTYIFKQYNQKNALEINDLWNIIQTTLKDNNSHDLQFIENIINVWITEKPYPRLFVERKRNQTLLRYNEPFDKNLKYLSFVTYTTKSNDYNSIWLDSPFVSKKVFDKNDWILVNLQQLGYYRVNYEVDNWKILTDYLFFENHTGIHVLNRAELIDDAFYFLTRNQISYFSFRDILDFLLKDTDYIVWYPMLKAVEYMTCIFGVQHTAIMKNKLVVLFDELLRNIGYDENLHDNDNTKCLREEAIKWACILGVKCRNIATSELERVLQSPVQNKYLTRKEWIYCKGLITADNSIWSNVWNKWHETSDNTLLEYLTCSTSTDININYLTLLMGQELQFFRLSNSKMFANILLLMFAKHAKSDVVLDFIMKQLKFIQFSSKKEVDHIAILIVIITHEHSVEQFIKIREFVIYNKMQLYDAVEQKIRKRKKEHGRQTVNMSQSVHRPMKYPYTLSAKIAQFPFKYYVNNSWMFKYWLIGIVVATPIFYKIQKLSFSPGNVEKWDKIHHEMFTGTGHH